MKIKDAFARLEQDIHEARAQGDAGALAIIMEVMSTYDADTMRQIGSQKAIQNQDQLISQIEQHINQHPASEKALSFALALSYMRRINLYMSDASADPLISFLENIIYTDEILQLPNLPEEFVRDIQALQQEIIDVIINYIKEVYPPFMKHITFLQLAPGEQARALLAVLKPELEKSEQSGESTPKVPQVEDLSVRTEQKSSRPEQPVANNYLQQPAAATDAHPRWLNLVDAMMYPLQHPSRLTNIIIGGVLVLVPIVGWLLITGYMIDVARRVIVGDTSPPEWADWGTKFYEGLTASLLAFIWLVILTGPAFFVVSNIRVGGAVILPFLGILAFYFLMPAFMGRYIATGNSRAGFEIGEMANMFGRNFESYLGNWFLAIVLAGIAFAILRAADLITFGIVLIFTTFYYSLFLAHLLGQLYRILDR